MADTSTTVRIIFEGDVSSAEASVGRLNTSLGKIEEVSGQATTKVDALEQEVDQLGDKSSKVDTLTASLQALAASLVVKAFIDANIEMEKFERGMTAVTGSSQTAAQEFEFVKSTANRLGISLFDASNAYLSLAAAAKGTALEGAATRSIFESVSFAMSMMGRSAAETEGALNAIQQMISKGTVSMEELRQQLGDRLPGALQRAAEGMGLTTEELIKLVSEGKVAASEFIPALDRALRNAFGDPAYVESYMASWNRLRNEIDLAFITIGKAGVFDALTKGVQTATAAVTGAVAAFTLLGELIGSFVGAVATGNFSALGTAIEDAFARAAAKTTGARDALLGYNNAAATTQQITNATASATTQAATQFDQFGNVIKSTGDAYTTLGLKQQTYTADINSLLSAFQQVATSATSSGKAITDGFLAVLKNVQTVDQYKFAMEELIGAWSRGQITTAQLNSVLDDGQKKLAEISGTTLPANTKALNDQAEATRKSEEAARNWALEMEKIASNERIKLIEAQIKLDIAKVEADAKIAVAAFQSIEKSVEDTGKTLVSLFGILAAGTSDWETWRRLTAEIERESQRREALIKAQIDYLKALTENLAERTKQLSRGEALIKIDGAGLQPHLEAFMWEILRTIQTRVNADGLELLVGA